MQEQTQRPDDENTPEETGATRASERGDKHKKENAPQSTGKVWRDRIILIAVIWAVWAFITSFIIQPFRIPSASMENTLHIGDRIVVSKFTPRFSSVKRGDVIVFKDPGEWTEPVSNSGISGMIRNIAGWTHLSASGAHLVKRVVGVGGDHVQCIVGKKLTVNGTPVNEPYIKQGQQACNLPFNITVPKDKVWVMGDNRGDSADSRYHDDGTGKMGSVPVSDITGKAVAIVWPLNRIGGAGGNEGAFKSVTAAK